LINVNGLTVIYPDGTRALNDVDITLRQGELVALTGPNGGGKTTLLRAISGIIPGFIKARVVGEVLVDGHRVTGPQPGIMAYMQPDPEVQVVGVTVLHEASICPSLMGLEKDKVLEKALDALNKTGLTTLSMESTPLLSTGLLQRTAIAGVLSCSPRYLLLDEPTGHLDPWASESIRILLYRLVKDGMGVIVATHDRELALMADRGYIVKGGVREGVWVHEYRLRERRSIVGERIISVRELWAKYPGLDKPILKGVNLEAYRGTFISIMGPNGSGKTTLLRVVAGFIKPLKGSVSVDGRVAYLPSNPLLLFSRPTLRRELPPNPPGTLGGLIDSILDKPILELSRGQLQLAALALVLASGSEVLLLDEPTHSLDPVNREIVVNTLAMLADAGYTIVAATHDRLVADASDIVYEIEDGVVYRQ